MLRQTSTSRIPELPLNQRHSADGKRGISRYRSPEKLVHLIPVVVLLCFLILWRFSYPVNLDMKSGRIIAAYRVAVENVTYLQPTKRASTFPPYEMQIMGNDSVVE